MMNIDQKKLNTFRIKIPGVAIGQMYDFTFRRRFDCAEQMIELECLDVCDGHGFFQLLEKCDGDVNAGSISLEQGHYDLKIKDQLSEIVVKVKVTVHSDKCNCASGELQSGPYFQDETYDCSLIACQ